MNQIWLIPAFPLLGFILNGLTGKFFGKHYVTIIAPICIAFSFLQSTVLFFEMLSQNGNEIKETLFTWMSVGNFNINVTFLVDRLSGVYLLIITGVGFLIHIYSIGYMNNDKGYYRYFAYLNLFIFFMLILILADNFLLMFVGWEGVGLCLSLIHI